MVWTIAKKELLENILSFRFIGSFVFCFFVIVISIYVQLAEYEPLDQRLASGEYARQRASSLNSYGALARLGLPVYRTVPKLRILCSGLGDEMAMRGWLKGYESPIFRKATYGKTGRSSYFIRNLFPPLFPMMDFVFIVNTAMSFLAILFTYDSIAGERKRKTLALVMSNAIPRSQLLLGKWLGGYITLMMGFVLCLLMGLSVILVSPAMSLNGQEWLSLALIFLFSVLYTSVFFSLGVLVSSLTSEPRAALLILIGIWTIFVLIIPNFSPYLAAKIHPTPTPFEIEYETRRVRNESYSRMRGLLDSFAEERGLKNVARNTWDASSKAEYDRYNAQVQREGIKRSARDFSRIEQNYNRALSKQIELGRTISCISPLASFTYLVSDLSATGIRNDERFRERTHQYQSEFTDYLYRKIGSDGLNGRPDISDLPLLIYSEEDTTEILSDGLLYLLLLVLFNVVCYMGAYLAFLRYDVR